MEHRRLVLNLVAWMTGAAAIGCAGPSAVTYSAINVPPRPLVPRAAADVEVVVGQPPARSHVDVGLFEVSQGTDEDGVGVSTGAMIATLREHAGLRGCDAVQVLSLEFPVEPPGHHSHRQVTAVCKVYSGDPAQQAAGQVRRAPPSPLPHR